MRIFPSQHYVVPVEEGEISLNPFWAGIKNDGLGFSGKSLNYQRKLKSSKTIFMIYLCKIVVLLFKEKFDSNFNLKKKISKLS